MRPLKNLSPKS